MSTSGTDQSKNILPGLNEQAKTGKDATIAPAALPETQAAPRNKSRKPRVREDVDPDYAEEAEDFYYGEGM